MKFTANQIIDKLGGTRTLAKVFNISDAAVSQWRSDGHIPQAREMYLRVVYRQAFKELENECPTQRVTTGD